MYILPSIQTISSRSGHRKSLECDKISSAFLRFLPGVPGEVVGLGSLLIVRVLGRLVRATLLVGQDLCVPERFLLVS